jgi:hypothetical protein
MIKNSYERDAHRNGYNIIIGRRHPRIIIVFIVTIIVFLLIDNNTPPYLHDCKSQPFRNPIHSPPS